MIEDINLIKKLCIDKVTKEVSKSFSSGYLSNCDNIRTVQYLIKAENKREPFGVRDGENNLVETTVIDADQTSQNSPSTIDSRCCHKPSKKVINEFQDNQNQNIDNISSEDETNGKSHSSALIKSKRQRQRHAQNGISEILRKKKRSIRQSPILNHTHMLLI